MNKSPHCLPQKGNKWRRIKEKINLMTSRFMFVAGCLFLSSACFAQNVEMADTMRSNGKIYVVVSVCLTILIGLFIYVFMLDKKISRVEKNKE